MNFVEYDNFDKYIESYKKLPLPEKKQLVEKQVEELLIVMDKLNEKVGNKSKVLFNREILDLKKEKSTESDFVEAMFVYFYSIKELLASLIDGLKK